jgi:4-hydroxy-2-oxoheptanedioate aldolase
MNVNRVEQKIQDVGRPLIGASMCRYDTDFVEIAAALGYHVVWADMEHCHIAFREAADICRLAQACGMIAMIRVPNAERENILRAAECGPDIIDVPMVNDAETAAELVAHGRYAPEGDRGFFGAQRSVRWGLSNDAEADRRMANERICLMAQIETAEAVDKAEAICGVPGVDSILIGRGDLSVSLGLAGQMLHPDVVAASERAFDAAKSAGKLVAIPGPLGDMPHWVAKGADMYFVANDLACMRSALETAMAQAKDAVAAADEQ